MPSKLDETHKQTALTRKQGNVCAPWFTKTAQCGSACSMPMVWNFSFIFTSRARYYDGVDCVPFDRTNNFLASYFFPDLLHPCQNSTIYIHAWKMIPDGDRDTGLIKRMPSSHGLRDFSPSSFSTSLMQWTQRTPESSTCPWHLFYELQIEKFSQRETTGSEITLTLLRVYNSSWLLHLGCQLAQKFQC